MSQQQKTLIAGSGQHVHVFSAEDITGQRAWYFIYASPRQYGNLKRALASEDITDLSTHGIIIASCYGEQPTQAVLDILKTEYHFDWKPQ